MNKQNKRSIKLVPAVLNGSVAMIALASLASNPNRVVHHGQFEGKQVNSPATLEIGDTVVVWPEAERKDIAVTIKKADFGLLAKQHLESQGYTVQKS